MHMCAEVSRTHKCMYTCVRVIPPKGMDATLYIRCPSIKIRCVQQNTNKDVQKLLKGPRGWRWRCQKREKTGRLTCFTSAGMLQNPPLLPRKKGYFLKKKISGTNARQRLEKFSLPFSPPPVSSRPPALFTEFFLHRAQRQRQTQPRNRSPRQVRHNNHRERKRATVAFKTKAQRSPSHSMKWARMGKCSYLFLANCWEAIAINWCQLLFFR